MWTHKVQTLTCGVSLIEEPSDSWGCAAAAGMWATRCFLEVSGGLAMNGKTVSKSMPVLETLAAMIIGLPNTQTNMIIARCMEAVTQL